MSSASAEKIPDEPRAEAPPPWLNEGGGATVGPPTMSGSCVVATDLLVGVPVRHPQQLICFSLPQQQQQQSLVPPPAVATAPASSGGGQSAPVPAWLTAAVSNQAAEETQKYAKHQKEKFDEMPKLWKTMRVWNCCNITFIFLACLVCFLSTATLTQAVLALYVLFFACIFLCFEAHVKGVAQIMFRNIGFMWVASPLPLLADRTSIRRRARHPCPSLICL